MAFAGCCCWSPGPECSEIFVELRTSFPLLGNYLILTMALIILQTSLRACFVWRFHYPHSVADSSTKSSLLLILQIVNTVSFNFLLKMWCV